MTVSRYRTPLLRASRSLASSVAVDGAIDTGDYRSTRRPEPVSSGHARFVTLDALRGIAAIVVAIYHAGVVLDSWVPRFGYLAVDLFFLLSGFVISYAYDHRLGANMSALTFLWLRVVRLYPLYVLGLVLGVGVAAINFDLGSVTVRAMSTNLGLNLFGLPAPPIEGFPANKNDDVLFPLNVPFWSLFFEFWVANVAYALTRNAFGWKALLITIAACAVALLVTEFAYHSLTVGWSWSTIVGGVPRVGFSFFAGVALSRLMRSVGYRWKLPAWPIVIMVPLLLCLPLSGVVAHLYELTCVLLIFPLLIYFGAGAIEKNPRIGEVLGDASYAIYTIHFPLLVALRWLVAGTALQPTLLLQFSFAAALVPLAWTLSRLDVAVRKWLLRLR